MTEPNQKPPKQGESGQQQVTPQSTYEPWPLDFLLLEKLPDKGLVGGIHWRGRQVKALVEEVNEGSGTAPVTSGSIQSRLRVMKTAGLVIDLPASGNRIWARLPASAKVLSKKESYLS